MDIIKKFQTEWERVQLHLGYVKVVSNGQSYRGPEEVSAENSEAMEKVWPDVVKNMERILTRVAAMFGLGDVEKEHKVALWIDLHDAYCKVLKVWEIQLAAVPVGASLAREWIAVGDHLTKSIVDVITKVEIEGKDGPTLTPFFAQLLDITMSKLNKTSQNNVVAANKRVIMAINCTKDAAAEISEEIKKSEEALEKQGKDGEDENNSDDEDEDEDDDFDLDDEWEPLDPHEIPVSKKTVEALEKVRDGLKQIIFILSKQVGATGSRTSSAVRQIEGAVEECESIGASVDHLANSTYTPQDPADVFQKAEALMQRMRILSHFIGGAVSEVQGSRVEIDLELESCQALEAVMDAARESNH